MSQATLRQWHPTIAAAVAERHGCLIESEVKTIAASDATRLMRVLVRCGGCRFECGAQDVAHLIEAVEAIGDYVRDVSVRPV
jgi:hypothetical protein